MSNNSNRILALGDSLTQGYIDDDISWYGGMFYPYTRTLASILKMPVDNQGVSGENTEEIFNRLKNIKRKYKYAIILAGTNDLEQKLNVKTTVTNIINMHIYCRLQLGVAKTYCLSVPEIIINSKKWKESDRKFINKNLLEFSKNPSKYTNVPVDVVYIPFAETFSTYNANVPRNNRFSSNGWHLSEMGYNKMAELIASYVSSVTRNKNKMKKN